MRVAIALGALAACGGPARVAPVSDAGQAPRFSDTELAAWAALAPARLPPPPTDPSNARADDDRAALFGQRLFFTPIFAGPLLDPDNNGDATTLGKRGDTGKVACASCHQPEAGFSDRRSPSQQISLASGWGKRKAPSLLDVGQARLLMWDGRHDALYNQVFGPIESPVEMNSSRLFVAEQVFTHFRAEYEAVFEALPPLDDAQRFPPLSALQTGCAPGGNEVPPTCQGSWRGYPGDQAEFDGLTPAGQEAVTRVVVNLGKALGAYERKLRCGPGRFDAWVHGDASALTESEQRGAQVFVGDGRCTDCHSGPYLSDQQFHNVGLAPMPVAAAFIDADDRGAARGLQQAIDDPLNVRGVFSDGDDGRLPAQVPPAAEGAFRTPTLRCVSARPSLLHTGQFKSLAAAVAFFSAGGHPGGFLGTSELHRLDLSSQQQSDLVAFLHSLDGPGPDDVLKAPPE